MVLACLGSMFLRTLLYNNMHASISLDLLVHAISIIAVLRNGKSVVVFSMDMLVTLALRRGDGHGPASKKLIAVDLKPTYVKVMSNKLRWNLEH